MIMRRSIFAFCISLSSVVWAGDWPDWRGPKRDGHSPEKGLPEKWSPSGENLAWKAPYGGRSAPVVFRDHVYLLNTSGEGPSLQERLLCFHADTGKVLWEKRFNVYLSDVPPHRAAWASPAVDPETGNVYMFGVGGHFAALDANGKILWERSLTEEMGLVTTHGGRTVSPVVDGEYVIVSGVTTGWGVQSRAQHRFIALDKKSGQTMWVSSPGGRPFDTTYSPPVVTVINGVRMLLAGGGDGTAHAIKVGTGEPVWKYVISKRGMNTGVVLNGTTAIVSHSEENLDSSDMGLLAAVDATARGEIGKDQIKWAVRGFQGGFSSPLLDGDRLYQIDNGANLVAFDAVNGRKLWDHNLGTIQKASPVIADGKVYVGTENGKFFILRPKQGGCDVVDEDLLGTEQKPETIIASAAIADGRLYVVSSDNLYAIGKKAKSPMETVPPPEKAPAGAAVAHVQVAPTELILKPGDTVDFHARLYDAQGRFIREDKATWALTALPGAVNENGRYTVPRDAAARAGEVKATVGTITGAARARVIPPLPWADDFESYTNDAVPSHWINTTGKFVTRQVESSKVLVKLADNPFTRRARAFFGPPDMSNYTVEVEFKATERRRQFGDAGVVAGRYGLVLFGNSQKLEIQPWQPETQRTVSIPFAWQSNTWYRMKLRVEPFEGTKIRARGKVWVATGQEPQEWAIEKVDPMPNLKGSAGLYADAPFEVFFDNLKVTAN